MSFWRFGFAQQSSIDALLSNIPAIGPDDGDDDMGPIAGPSTTVTLEQILEEDDLLQELKAGNAKLADFLSRAHVIRRMLAYVDGSALIVDPLSDSAFDEPEEERERKRRKYPYLCAEILCSDIWSIIEPLFRSRGTDFLGPFWDAVLDRSPDELAGESVQLAFWAKVNGAWLGTRTSEMIAFIKSRPRVVERLLSHIASTSIADLVFRLIQCEDTSAGAGIIDWLASEHLIPRLISLLSPSHPPDTHLTVAEFLKAIIAFCSNANANAATADAQNLGGPNSLPPSVGTGGWGSDDYSAEVSSPPPPAADSGPKWASNKLLHELAAEHSVATLVGYMLDDFPLSDEPAARNGPSEAMALLSLPSKAAPSLTVSTDPNPRDRSMSPNSEGSTLDGVGSDGPSTPRASVAPIAPLVAASSIPLPPSTGASDLASSIETSMPSNPSVISATSSLINSVSVLIDLIRKNNSDFTEQQILHSLRKEARQRELNGNGIGGSPSTARSRGPSIVNLSTLLTVLSARLGDFQRLLKRPRSSTAPLETSIGLVEPLTIERFRLCELYAELLHCSNMALLNRAPDAAPMYDEDGYLIDGVDAIDRLAAALTPTDPDSPPIGQSGPADTSLSRLSTGGMSSSYTSPVVPGHHAGPGSDDDPLGATSEVALDSPSGSPTLARRRAGTSGSSTPSEQASLDSESGVLTRSEARALRALIEDDELDEAAAAMGDVSIGDSSSDGHISPRVPNRLRRRTMSNGRHHRASLKPRLPPGELLKTKFIEHGVIDTMLDLFFRFPWNNFLHGVVYDLVQQSFVARMDRELNRRLCLTVFLDAHITDRILDANAANERSTVGRMGYMAHLSLVAEEVVKLFQNYPDLIHEPVAHTIRQPDWDRYAATTLRETRERDLLQLGGGVGPAANAPPSSAGGTARAGNGDEEDEFPMSGNGARVVDELGDGVPSGSPPPDPLGPFGASLGTSPSGGVSAGVLDSSATTDQFARYLVQQISSDLPDKFSNSSSDDDEDPDDVAAWLGDSAFDPKDVDFELGGTDDPQTAANRLLGATSRWSPSGSAPSPFSAAMDSDEDDGFGDFVGPSSSASPPRSGAALSSSPPGRITSSSSPHRPSPLSTSPTKANGVSSSPLSSPGGNRPRSTNVVSSSPTSSAFRSPTKTGSGGSSSSGDGKGGSTPNSRRDPFGTTSPPPTPTATSRRAPPPPLPVKDRLTPADWDAAFASSDDPFADHHGGGGTEGEGEGGEGLFGSWQTSEAEADVDWGEFEIGSNKKD